MGVDLRGGRDIGLSEAVLDPTRRSLADAILQAERGGDEGGPPFEWDIMLDIGDVSGSGTPPDQLRRAIEIGVSKVNVATELSQAYVGALQQAIEAKGSEIWYAQALEQATSAVAQVVEKWMRQLGSAGRIA